MIKLLISLLSISGFFSMKNVTPIKGQKAQFLGGGNVKLRNVFEVDGKSLVVEVSPQNGEKAGLRYQVIGDSDLPLDQNTFRRVIKGYNFGEKNGIQKEQIDQVINDFKKQGQLGPNGGFVQTEFFVVGDEKEAEELLNGKVEKHIKNRLDQKDADKGAGTEKTFEIAKGRKLTIESVVAVDNDIHQKVRRLKFTYQTEFSAANLDKSAFTEKSLIALVADVDSAFIMEESHIDIVYKKLFLPGGHNFEVELQQISVEYGTQKANDNPFPVDTDSEVGPSYEFALANGKKIKIMISDKNEIKKDFYEITFTFVISGAITVQKAVTEDEIVTLLASLNTEKDRKWNIKKENIQPLVEDANSAEVGKSIFQLKLTILSSEANLTDFVSPDGTEINKVFKQQNQGLIGGEIIGGQKYEIKLDDFKPQILSGKLSNGQTYSLAINKKKSGVLGQITEIVVSITGAGSTAPVPASEIVKIIKTSTQIDVLEEQAVAISTSINGSIQITATIVSNSMGKIYYPDIKANGPEVKFRIGDRWLTLAEFEIYKKQNAKRFVADDSGHIYYYYDTLGAGFGQRGQKGGAKKFEFDFSKLDAQLEALAKEAEKAFLGQKETDQKYFSNSKGMTKEQIEKMFGQEFSGKGLNLGGNYIQFLNDGNIHSNVKREFFQMNDGLNIKIGGGGGKQQVIVKEVVRPTIKFANGNIYIGEIGMSKEEYQKYLLSLDEETAAWFAKTVDMQGFEASIEWHVLNGKRINDQEFKAYLKAHPKELIIESQTNIGTFFYYNGQKMDEVTWFAFVNKNPDLGFAYVDGNWVQIQKMNYEIGVDNGFVIINKQKYTWEQFVAFKQKESKNWNEATKMLFAKITEERVFNSKPRGFAGFNEVRDDNLMAFIQKNPDVPIYLLENDVVFYYYKGKKYTEAEFDSFVSQGENKKNFIKKDGRWVFVAVQTSQEGFRQEQDKVIIGQKNDGKKTLREKLGEQAFKKMVIMMQKQGAYYDEVKGDFVGVEFRMDVGKLICNGKPCGTYQEYLNWYNTYIRVMDEQYRARFQLIDEKNYGDFFKPYLVGDKRMTESEFNAWKAKHQGVNVINEKFFYRIKVFTIDDQEFTEDEIKAYIKANPWSGIQIVGGGISRKANHQISFRKGKVYLNDEEVTWEYFDGFKKYWLKFGDEQVVRLLNSLDKKSLEESAKVYNIENKWYTKEELEAWLKQGDHSKWIFKEIDGFVYYQKPQPFAVYNDMTFWSEAEFRKWASTQTNYKYELFGNKIIRVNIGQKGGVQMGVKDPYAQIPAKPVSIEIKNIKNLNFKFTSSITKETLKSLYLSGILKISSGIVDADISETNAGFSNNRIKITKGSDVCELRLIKAEADYFFHQVDPSQEFCKTVLAYGDLSSTLSCPENRSFNDLKNSAQVFINRFKNQNFFNDKAVIVTNQAISCATEFNTVSTLPPRNKMVYTMGFGIAHPKKANTSVFCQYTFIEINNNLSGLANADELSEECASVLSPRRIVV